MGQSAISNSHLRLGQLEINGHIKTESPTWLQHLLSQGDKDSDIVHNFLLCVGILPISLSCNTAGSQMRDYR